MCSNKLLMEGEGIQGSDLWLKEREGKLNASDAHIIVGEFINLSSQEYCFQQLNNPSKKIDPNDDMNAGTANEDAIACEAARLLGFKELRQPNSFLHPFYSFVRASPDRLILDLALIKPWLFIECKFSRHKLYEKPKSSHLLQVTQQMQILCADYCFLAYGHRPKCTKEGGWLDGEDLQVRVYRVEYSEKLWRWMLQRYYIFEKCKKEKRKPSEDEIPHLKGAIQHYWDTGKLPKWVINVYSKIYKENPQYLMPPRPNFNLVCDNLA